MAHNTDVDHPETAPQLNEGSSGLEGAPRAVVGYRVRVDGAGPCTCAYREPKAEGMWEPTNDDEPKPAPISRARAMELLHLCRAWAARIPDSGWAFRLVKVVRRG